MKGSIACWITALHRGKGLIIRRGRRERLRGVDGDTESRRGGGAVGVGDGVGQVGCARSVWWRAG